MNEQGFVDRRELDWKRLAEICDMADNSIKRLTAAEVREFVRLYRRVSTDLAFARTQSRNLPLIQHLNDLIGRAYGILYRSPRKQFFPSLLAAIATCTQTVRRNRWFLATSAGIFFGSAIFIFAVMSWFPAAHDQIIPPGMESLFDDWEEGYFLSAAFRFRVGHDGRLLRLKQPANVNYHRCSGCGKLWPLFPVALRCLRTALFSARSPTEMAGVGKLGFLICSISPHGVPELSGIVVAGGSGMLLAYALINPGRRRRADALRLVGKDAIVLLATSVCLMFIAAPIEGFFSFQPHVPTWLKASVAVVEVCGWATLWIFFARDPTVEKHALAED